MTESVRIEPPQSPIPVALIGCGRRGQGVYFPIMQRLTAFYKVVAVCDRVPELAKWGGEAYGVPAYESLRELLRDNPMEAAIVVTPPSSHHAISCFLSQHKVHHLVETPMCDTLAQARAMVAQAKANGVTLRINEQFFRDSFDVVAREVLASGVLGALGRITNYHAHLGYHNNSRHQMFAGCAPVAVNAVEHSMPVAHYVNTERHYESERWRNRSFHFPNGVLVSDIAGNIKGALGRTQRPGLHEIDAARGSIVMEPCGYWTGRAEVRIVPSERLTDGSGGFSDAFPIEWVFQTTNGQEIVQRELRRKIEFNDEAFLGARVRLPDGEFWARNPVSEWGIHNPYLVEVAEGLAEFAGLLGGNAVDSFPPQMAVTSQQMEIAADFSAMRDGARVGLDDPGLDEIDVAHIQAVRERLGIDPLDVEANIDFAFPKP